MGEHVTTGTGDGLGIITLNRPEKINALTHGMVRTIAATLAGWREDREVRIVVLRGAGERGFCAGGDINGLPRIDHARAGRRTSWTSFRRVRPGPVIADLPQARRHLRGRAVHGRRRRPCRARGRAHRHPAVPGRHAGDPHRLLPRRRRHPPAGQAPGGSASTWADRTASMGAGDAIDPGFADFCAAQEAFADVLATLPDFAGMSAEEIAAGLEVLLGSTSPLSFTAAAAQRWIDPAFAPGTLAEILAALDASPYPRRGGGRRGDAGQLPDSLEIALRAIRAARAEDDLRTALEREHRIAAFLMTPGPGRGHPRPGHRQGPRPALVAGQPRGAGPHHGRRGRGRRGVAGGEFPLRRLRAGPAGADPGRVRRRHALAHGQRAGSARQRAPGQRVPAGGGAAAARAAGARGRGRSGWACGCGSWPTAASSTLDLKRVAMPFMEDVNQVVRQNTQLAVLHDDEVLVLERLSRPGSVVNQAYVAGRMPVHLTSMGMALLAFSPPRCWRGTWNATERCAPPTRPAPRARAHPPDRVRRLDGFIDTDTTGVAVPVLDRRGHALAVLAVVVPRGSDLLRPAVMALRTAARGISRGLGEMPPG